MNHFFALCFFLYAVSLVGFLSDRERSQVNQKDYTIYHRTIAKAQKHIAHRQYQQALDLYRQVFNTYAFVFSRDYKVATQLALLTGQKAEALTYLKKAIATGWRLSEMKKNALVNTLQRDPDWKIIKNQYDSLRAVYQQSGNKEVRNRVEKLFKKDQRKALLALFTVGSKGQDRYAEKRFAPHSAKQVAELNQIMEAYEYPSERLIGNGYWASVIVSHHNSISQQYARKDTLYPFLKPKLLNAVRSGAMSPYELAMIDDWYTAVKSDQQDTHFGYLSGSLTSKQKLTVDQFREELGLNDIETISLLADLQQQTGFNVYLPANMVKKISTLD